MAQKESSHREAVDALNTELSQVRKQFEELSVLSRDQVRSAKFFALAVDSSVPFADSQHVYRD